MRTKPTTVDELTSLLQEKGLITEEQAAMVRVKAENQRARLQHQQLKAGSRRTAGMVSPAEIIASMELQKRNSHGSEVLDEDEIVSVLAESAGKPYLKIDPLKLDASLITSTISLPFARRTSVLPLKRDADILRVAVSDPHDQTLFDELARITGCTLDVVVSSRTDIQRFITEVYGFKRSVAKAAREMSPTIDLGNLEQLIKLGAVDEIEANDKHVINAVEYILHYAFDQRASDIHIEPKREASHIRMRIDGILHDIYTVPKAVHPAIVTRLKTMTRLDLAERRRPQDGRFKTDKAGEEVEMRVSTLPVAFGEKVVIRIFDSSLLFKEMVDLGFDDESYEHYLEFVSRPSSGC